MKFLEEKIARVLMVLSVIIVAFFVFSVVGSILWRGLPALSWDMITKVPTGGFYIGGEGGFLNAILGSLYIVLASTLLGLLISIPVVFYLNVYLKPNSKFAAVARLAYDILFGVPSIVYGAFGFTIMIWLGLRASLLGGIIVETLLVIPILIRTIDEVAKNIPRGMMESSYSLGATRLDTIGIVVRQIGPAIATATLLAVGRSIGDAAGCDVHRRLLRPDTNSSRRSGSNAPVERLFPVVCSSGSRPGPCLCCRCGADGHRLGPQSHQSVHPRKVLKEQGLRPCRCVR